MKKAERYDALATLMGFTEQVNYMKSLRSVQKQCGVEAEKAQKARKRDAEAFLRVSGARQLTPDAMEEASAALTKKYEIPPIRTLTDFTQAESKLECVLSSLREQNKSQLLVLVSNELKQLVPSKKIEVDLDLLVADLVRQRDSQSGSSDSLRVQLYETALRVVDHEGDDSRCPVCDEPYSGSLHQHIRDSVQSLRIIAQQIQDFERMRAVLLEEHGAIQKWPDALTTHAAALQIETIELELAHEEYNRVIKRFSPVLSGHVIDIDPVEVRELAIEYKGAVVHLNARIAAVQNRLDVKQTLPENDRAKSVAADLMHIRECSAALRVVSLSHARATRLATTHKEFSELVDEFVGECTDDVKARFGKISDLVSDFFTTLERDSPLLGVPTIKISEDAERAVTLEVEFDGSPISPAYKYLSESQLNSFGLSVFLACVRTFNSGFPFIILDDVVNSLDGHKRPKLIEILRDRFPDFQVVLMTHDSVWRTQLQTAFPQCKSVAIARFNPASGPVVLAARVGFVSVYDDLENGDVISAGQRLGRLIEADLQDIAEAIQAQVPYRRRNDAGLDLLLTSSASRLAKELGESHPSSKLLKAFREDAIFRNYMAHPKELEIGWSAREIKSIADNWAKIRKSLSCEKPNCGWIATGRIEKALACRCGETIQRKA